jgi:hypothetical protein
VRLPAEPWRSGSRALAALTPRHALRRHAPRRAAAQVADGDCPHVLFYGPSGAGKKTLVLALLREIYGPGVERIKVEGKQWKIDVGSRKVDVELTLLSSNHHVEMNPSDAGSKDRYVVQEVIKEMARARPIGVDGTKGYKGARCLARVRLCACARAVWRVIPDTCARARRRGGAVLVLNEVDKLSKEAQHGLRRTMEKYSGAYGTHAVSLCASERALTWRCGACRGVPAGAAVQQHLACAGCRALAHAARARAGAHARGDLRPAAAAGAQGEHCASRRVRSARRCVMFLHGATVCVHVMHTRLAGT